MKKNAWARTRRKAPRIFPDDAGKSMIDRAALIERGGRREVSPPITWLKPDGLPQKQRILVVSPHSDDFVYGAGATIHELRRRGNSIHVAIMSRGYRGVEGKGIKEATKTREQEAIDSARVLGLRRNQLSFQRLSLYEKRTVTPWDIRKVNNLVRRFKPNIVLMPSHHDVLQYTNRLSRDVALGSVIKQVHRTGRPIEVWTYQTLHSPLPATELRYVVEFPEGIGKAHDIKFKAFKEHVSQMPRHTDLAGRAIEAGSRIAFQEMVPEAPGHEERSQTRRLARQKIAFGVGRGPAENIGNVETFGVSRLILMGGKRVKRPKMVVEEEVFAEDMKNE